MAKKKKVRVDLRKNRSKPPRQRDWTRQFEGPDFEDRTGPAGERVRAKGELSRRRTVIQQEPGAGAGPGSVGEASEPGACLPGRVLRVYRRCAEVESADGTVFRCAVRRLLWTMAADERNVVTAGDRVWFRPVNARPAPSEAPEAPPAAAALPEGLIERVEPRHGTLTRASKGREHVLVSNVDQVAFVVSLVEPDLKPHLIDRYLAGAVKDGVPPLLCLNKADLVEPARYQPVVGFYSQLGVPTFLTSATTGVGLEFLRERLKGRETVFAGQSGVGKSSLLNAVQPGLGLRVREVSESTQKGRHTTTTAELIRLDFGGWVVDTAGVRQFGLWGALPEEMEGFFVEFRPWVPLCAYPDCTHTHEDRCAVKRAVARRQLSAARYTSYFGLFTGTELR